MRGHAVSGQAVLPPNDALDVMTLEPTQIIATAATLYGVGGALSVLLQARQMLARGASCDVSLRFLATYVGGYAVWLLYGVSVQSVPIVLVHALGLLTGSATLIVALRLRGLALQPLGWTRCA
jgi:hypothetical protein